MARKTWSLGTALLVSCLFVSGCILPQPEGNASTDPGKDPVPTPSTGQPTATPTDIASPTPWYEGDFQTQTSSPTPSPTPFMPSEPWPQVLRLNYTLVSHDDAHRSATPGGHCPTAYVQDDIAYFLEAAYPRDENVSALVIIYPSLDGNWSTIGTASIFTRLPAPIDPHVEDYGGSLPVLAWDEQSGRALVNWHEVDLPYHWSFEADDGSWSIDAELSMGPEEIRTWQREQPCI